MPAYAPFKPSDSEQRSLGSSYRGCWHELSPSLLWISQPFGFVPTFALYNAKAFIAHAASLVQAFAH